MGKKEEVSFLPEQTFQKVQSGYGEGDVNSYAQEQNPLSLNEDNQQQQ